MKRPDNLHESHFDEMIIGGEDKEPLQNVSKDMCRESEANDISAKYPCPCFGYYTLPVDKSEAIAYICPVCFWENDVFTKSDDEPSDENRGMTLNEAKEEYKRIGATHYEFLKYVRNQYPEEKCKK